MSKAAPFFAVYRCPCQAAQDADPADDERWMQVRVVTFSFLCQQFEKYGTFIARRSALIEKVSPCIQDVARPAIAIHGALGLLSSAWARGVKAATLSLWVHALAIFCRAIDSKRNVAEGEAAIHIGWFFGLMLPVYVFMPLLIMRDVAATGSRCDKLMQTLNEIGIEHGTSNHLTVDWLECRLARLNAGQGLGFRVGGVVVDNRALLRLAGVLSGGLSFVLTFVLAAAEAVEEDGVAETTLCALTPAEVDTVQGLLGQRNATCFFNMTVQDVLDM
eukprot:SAG31_NODE_548_length_14222_cov_10.926574_17_plen_275_part_00